MQEHGILFRPEMVAAILRDAKTQTRRLKERPWRVGDTLWVKEPWRVCGWCEDSGIGIEYRDGASKVECYKEFQTIGKRDYLEWRENIQEQCCNDLYALGFIDGSEDEGLIPSEGYEGELCPTRWRQSIFMPRGCSRIDLRVTGVREERLQDISEADAIAEGGWIYKKCPFHKAPEKSFAHLWDSINTKPGTRWKDNPPVWVYEFERVEE